jgi:hypothetical protein
MKWITIYKDSEVKSMREISDTDRYLTNRSFFKTDTQEEAFTEVENRGLSFIFTSGNTKEIVFSGGGRTIRDIILNNLNND